ncbi:Alpha/beta hydrolase family protein [uncultured Eubacteriales bacterium]|uniref:Alpha/beta hydrolase family protein n=1 Tax=uncultured Eubacteriales bacterium TaxID=172733 RepID=A0A212JR72_9FIRM|nr:Alpha/beta hydrolase family protein [uncultured Eubacteriales bacterium]
MPMTLGIVGAVLLCLAALAGWYLYRNIHYDNGLMMRVNEIGFTEKTEALPDGSVLCYGEGPDNGPALLLIHGQDVAWEEYDRVLPELAKSFHVYAVDCYGHGGSSHEAALYSCRANGEALVWFMDNVIGEKCYLSGHSSGGILAAWLAANAPERTAGLLLEDPPLFHVTPEEIQEGNGAFAWYDGYVVTHDFVRQKEKADFSLYYLEHGYLLSLFGGLREKIIRAATEYRQENPDRPIKLAWIPHAWLRTLLYMDNYDPRFGEAFYDGTWMEGVDQEALLEKIQCPTIYLKANTQYGKDGVLYAANTDADADKVQQLIDGCERVNVKSGHDIHFERPEVFLSACERLLGKR